MARFAPSGANIQPWHVYVLTGATKDSVSAALVEAHEMSPEEHVSEYKYYASDLPEPILSDGANSDGSFTTRSELRGPIPKLEADKLQRTTRSSARRSDSS
ncbi:nitroreductase family protein [Bradyrhizobium sp. 151]|uniref:nitroreductase family protein n=1 Tax=Bradyrhizobium sp. 151 TaxID=2782626 RepID=UPI001FFBBEA3